ncbi:efflux RND transporter periplasmic adaptor subunit [Carboxylicivirga sediminis]|uniref:efflux RND transporter periplasmic adaptor subunit n=1 Tax=Carboxylicivirga sediminis TaxID=2006564 RepID=UPI001FD11C34|nr:efflux RND transporter periplasmic adaptor subunit [Carboxylicivirga sediminis]
MNTIFQYIKANYKPVLITLAIGLLVGWAIAPSGSGNAQADAHEGHQHEEETVWTCSMHPQIKQNEPGLCPICAMDLIPLAGMQSAENADPNEVVMTEAAAKLAEVETSVVQLGKPVKEVYLQGKIHVDERRIAELTARYGGRIEQLNINFTGQNVRKGQKLATIYSPDLVSAQRELIEAFAVRESNPSLYMASKSKLQAWDLTDEQIAAIEKSGEPQVYFDILSPISGTVMMRHVALGDYVKQGMPLFKVADLTKVWALFDAYETDLPWVKQGDKVSFTLEALPGETFAARVTYVDPIIDAKTRVAKVRVEVANSNLQLKPEMFANAVLEARLSNEDVMVIPKSAVLWTGKRAVVYTKVPERETPTFLFREITLGPDAGDNYIVKEGLSVGEEIATNGVFKIDASAQLMGLKSMMNAPETHNKNKASFTVAGNCDMCKERIEKAAMTVFGVVSAEWSADAQEARVVFDPEHTNADAIQKAIAQVGHDTEKYKADDAVYETLHSCCLYERLDKQAVTKSSAKQSSQTKHAMVKVAGNCGMCQERIEEAALSVEGVTMAKWDKDTKMLHLNYGGKATVDAVEKAIAAVGHDTEHHKADDSVYGKLPGCCHYDRIGEPAIKEMPAVQSKHAMVKVAGNCGMCQERIEEAALSVEGVTTAKWDKDTKMLHLNYSGKATVDAVEKAIATVGHDTEHHKADDEVYDNLHGCCQYERF